MCLTEALCEWHLGRRAAQAARARDPREGNSAAGGGRRGVSEHDRSQGVCTPAVWRARQPCPVPVRDACAVPCAVPQNAEKAYIRKNQVEDREWCATFDRVIGPFEAKYEECQADVVKMFHRGKAVYEKSFQKLIDEFGFHPAFKRWFDDF